MTDGVRKLLGGYATGTLTPGEQQALYEAALQDQALFEALANEQALKELLDDPGSRAQVLQATETHVFSIRAALRQWFDRPRSKALVATGAVLVVAIAFTTYRDQQKPVSARIAAPRPEPSLVAVAPPEKVPIAPRSLAPERRVAKREIPCALSKCRRMRA